MPRIYDTVIVSSESDLDLLEARFREFEDLDVVHVIAEAAAAYDGSPKPFHFITQRDDGAHVSVDRFARWHGRWNHVKVEAHELPSDQDPKARKEALREWLRAAITAEPDDIVLHGGIDEIPSAAILPELHRAVLPVVLEMRLCAYRPGLVHSLPWRGTAAVRYRELGSLSRLREDRHGFPALLGAGTRLAMLGDDPQPVYTDGQRLREIDVDDTWPRYFREAGNPDR